MRVGARHDVPFHVDRSDRQIDTCVLRTSDRRYVEVGSGIFFFVLMSSALPCRSVCPKLGLSRQPRYPLWAALKQYTEESPIRSHVQIGCFVRLNMHSALSAPAFTPLDSA